MPRPKIAYVWLLLFTLLAAVLVWRRVDPDLFNKDTATNPAAPVAKFATTPAALEAARNAAPPRVIPRPVEPSQWPEITASLQVEARAWLAKPPVINSLGMKLVPIPPGTFLMGSPRSEAGHDEGEIQHYVTLTRGFYMSATVVTQAQWRTIMGEIFGNSQGANLPVHMISWENTQEFCDRLGAKEGRTYRLPTESEWEYACRAGTTTAFNTGDNAQTLAAAAWYDANSGGTIHPVGLKKPNAWGLYDMHGNLWQWCSDWYGDYPTQAVIDPTGPLGGTARVLRGGTWGDAPADCRSAFRSNYPPTLLYGDSGVRVVMEADK